MVTLVIGSKKQGILMSDGLVQTFPIVVVNKGKAKPLMGYREFSGIREVRLFRYHEIRRIRKLPVPFRLRRVVARTLNRYHGKFEDSFDCHAFVHLACGIPFEKDQPILDRWKPVPWSDGPRPGEAVFLVDLEQFIFPHSAVFLGQDLYLSVYGKGGILQVSALSDMLRDYGTEHVLKMRPRNTD